MQHTSPRIIVLTPNRNDGWILERFLSVTSQFADYILLADQHSTDNSLEICKRYPKVVLFSNENQSYDEADRQKLLINKARELVPGPRILLALDTDEILAANALETVGWQTMLNAVPGTVLYFEKPDLVYSPNLCIRWEKSLFPLGYVDDGAEHIAKKIHSTRIPMPSYAQHLYLHDIKVLHYAFVRVEAQNSKHRYYSVLENVNKTSSLYHRRKVYNASKPGYLNQPTSATPKIWFENWEKKGIDMYTITTSKYFWYDYEVLKIFSKYGTDRFNMDDIWKVDWEELRQHALKNNIAPTPAKKIKAPGFIWHFFGKTIDLLYLFFSKMKA